MYIVAWYQRFSLSHFWVDFFQLALVFTKSLSFGVRRPHTAIKGLLFESILLVVVLRITLITILKVWYARSKYGTLQETYGLVFGSLRERKVTSCT